MYYDSAGRITDTGIQASTELERYTREWILANYQPGANRRELECLAYEAVSIAFLLHRFAPITTTGDKN